MDFEDKQKKNEEIKSKITNLETRIKALDEEANAKLKAGDQAGAKRSLAKKRKLEEQVQQLLNSY